MSSPLKKFWVDPEAFPDAGDVSKIGGNCSSRVKQLSLNTFMAYGVGDEDCFAHAVGKKVTFTYMNADVGPSHGGEGREDEAEKPAKAKTVAEIVVDKSMVNGNGMMHGGCIAYLIDNCGSSPLVVLGLVLKKNGVGVTQSLNVLYHSPAPIGATLRIVSSSLALGGRLMIARCEIFDKATGRRIASAFINKMQPSKL